MRQRHWLAVLGLAGLLVVAGTSGFSTVTADRSADVAVVADERAYLGVETANPSLEAGHHEEVRLAELENRFGNPLTDVDIVVHGNKGTPPVMQGHDAPDALGVGGEGAVTATVNCDAGSGSPDTETWTVSITASGPNTEVTLDRTVTVTCKPQPPANATAATNSTGTPS